MYTFRFAADDGRMLSVFLESFIVPSVSTGSAFAFPVILTSTAHPVVTQGSTYWVARGGATNSSPAARTVKWNLNSQRFGGLNYFNGSWPSIGNPSPAFEANGPAPETASPGLLALDLGALLLRFRRRNHNL